MPREQRPKFAGLDFFLDMSIKALEPDFKGVDNDLHEVKILGKDTNNATILAYQSAVNKYPELEIIY